MFKILCLSHGEYLEILSESIWEQDNIISEYNTKRALKFPGYYFNGGFEEAIFKTHDLAYFYVVGMLERARQRTDLNLIFEQFQIIEV